MCISAKFVCVCWLSLCIALCVCVCQWRTEGGLGCSNPPPPEILKAPKNRAKLNPIVKTVKNAEFRTPTHQDVRKKGVKF